MFSLMVIFLNLVYEKWSNLTCTFLLLFLQYSIINQDLILYGNRTKDNINLDAL